jgi:hypothetical protein
MATIIGVRDLDQFDPHMTQDELPEWFARKLERPAEPSDILQV